MLYNIVLFTSGGEEKVVLAVGHSSVESAARINRAVVLFLAKVKQVNKLGGDGELGGRTVRPGHTANTTGGMDYGMDYLIQCAAGH